ncbi:septation protein SepH [Microbacterium gorillae]|uniref:septation protein SepH n=1 Tax=Microbacterium gorillae TaxID=1231063 RepID=UPI00058F1BDE|nr:septation protein SepH [Microbacterium gorillae]
MEQLTIIGTEDTRLVLVAEGGERFTLAIDDVLHSELKKARLRGDKPDAPRASPREIQSHIRAGMSAADVAELLETSIEDVERYEGPVLAEREHVVGQALAVPVLMGTEVEPDGTLSFGTAIRAKLAELEAGGERWTSWKDENGWTIKLEFIASEVEHDARWGFDPRRSTLSPQNSAATQLSRQGSLPDGLIPRLRALDTPSWKDDSRFDSGAFGPRRLPEPAPETNAAEDAADARAARGSDIAARRAPEPAATANPDTADLLEALRRRRGQRESAPGTEESELTAAPGPLAPPTHTPSPAPVNLFQVDESGDDEEIVAEKHAAERSDRNARRKGRPSMPSWDDIVFGARSDD